MTQNPKASNNQAYVDPDVKEFWDRRMRDIMARINCVNLGTIVSFDATKQTASVNVNFQKVLRGVNALPGILEASDQVVDFPLLQDVPVVFLGGGVSYLTFPIAPGDSCVLLFNDRDMDNWMATGVKSIPATTRTHDVSDAVALVGIRNLLNPIPDFNTIIASLIDKTGERLSQAGDLKATARITAPSGWLLCFGQEVNRDTFDVLFTAIGTTYGAGDGSTTFNLPDLRGRFPVGRDNMGGTNADVLTNTYNPNRNVLGGTIGEEAHELSESEHHVHNHDVTPVYMANGAGGLGYQGTNNGDAPTTLHTQNEGDSVAHQNVQPGMIFNWVIKY